MRTAEVLASRILFWGGVLSILVMTLGIVGFAARGGLEELGTWGAPGAPQAPREPPAVYTSIGQVGRALARWPVEPLAIVATGIVLLLMTPFVSVVCVFLVFAVGGDRRYAGLSALLVGALLVSLLVIGGTR